MSVLGRLAASSAATARLEARLRLALLCAALAGCRAPRTAGEAGLVPVERAAAPAPAPAEAAPAEVAPVSPPAAQPPGGEVSGEVSGEASGDVPAPAAEPAAEPAAPDAEAAAPAESPAAAPAPPTAPQLVHGSFAVRYLGRFTGDEQDHDLRGLLALDLADPRAPWITGHLLARADLDLNGANEGPVFDELDDTFDGSLDAKVYAASVDLALGAEPKGAPGVLRIGRQTDPDLPEVLRLDGLSFRSRPLGDEEVELGLYGGVPARLYQDSREGDRAYGTFVEAQPWRGGRARFDWMHLEDEELLGEQRDDLIALGLWQRLEHLGWLEGEFTRLEGENRDLSLRALYQPPDSKTIARLTYFELLETQTVRVPELDAFTPQLQEYFPFRQAGLNVSQALGENAALDLGYDMRRVSDSGDVGEFNRDWQRLYATATLHDALAKGVSLALTGDRWNDEQRDESALGADLSYADEGPWQASLGTYYALYKYELLELAEREDVRTYYLRGTYDVSKRLRLELGYEFENDDFDTYHTLRGGARWSF